MILSRLQIMELAIKNAGHLKVTRNDVHKLEGFYVVKNTPQWVSLMQAPIEKCASCGQPMDIGVLHMECGQWTR